MACKGFDGANWEEGNWSCRTHHQGSEWDTLACIERSMCWTCWTLLTTCWACHFAHFLFVCVHAGLLLSWQTLGSRLFSMFHCLYLPLLLSLGIIHLTRSLPYLSNLAVFLVVCCIGSYTRQQNAMRSRASCLQRSSKPWLRQRTGADTTWSLGWCKNLHGKKFLADKEAAIGFALFICAPGTQRDEYWWGGTRQFVHMTMLRSGRKLINCVILEIGIIALKQVHKSSQVITNQATSHGLQRIWRS